MRNVCPPDAVRVVDRNHSFLRAVVALQNVAIRLRERIAGERLALVDAGMDVALEFGEHRLPEERAPQLFERGAKIVEALVVGFRRLEHML